MSHREDLEQVTSSPGISVSFFHDHPAHVMGLLGVLNEGMYLEPLALGLAKVSFQKKTWHEQSGR